ncbi:MAG: hypothetical protein Q9192_002408 [Flavoplaca navasiana]
MPSSEALTDDYVAQLLAKDAKDRTIKYSSFGLQAILPKRPTTNAPKPNTRFLKNIIKETDSHNAALRAKEIADARIRLRGINETETATNDTTDEEEGMTKSTVPIQKPSAPTIVDTIADDTREAPLPTRTELESEGPDIDFVLAQDPCPDQGRDQDRHTHTNVRIGIADPTTNTAILPPSSDSDPLTSLIGPLPPNSKQNPKSPPPLRRGRGTHTLHSSSAPMDTHFASTYDPTIDIQATALDPAEEDDWDNALEALRDRAKWRSSGAERLRAAGFTDEEIRKWEKSGDGEGREVDVRWRGAGEGREWDRGKVVGDDGVQVEAEWGRLKGT